MSECISHSLPKMVMISVIVCDIWQNSILFINRYKIIFCMVAMATSRVRKKLHLSKYYNLNDRLSFYIALKGISKLWFFSQNLEDIFGVLHQCIMTVIPYQLHIICGSGIWFCSHLGNRTTHSTQSIISTRAGRQPGSQGRHIYQSVPETVFQLNNLRPWKMSIMRQSASTSGDYDQQTCTIPLTNCKFKPSVNEIGHIVLINIRHDMDIERLLSFLKGQIFNDLGHIIFDKSYEIQLHYTL